MMSPQSWNSGQKKPDSTRHRGREEKRKKTLGKDVPGWFPDK